MKKIQSPISGLREIGQNYNYRVKMPNGQTDERETIKNKTKENKSLPWSSAPLPPKEKENKKM